MLVSFSCYSNSRLQKKNVLEKRFNLVSVLFADAPWSTYSCYRKIFTRLHGILLVRLFDIFLWNVCFFAIYNIHSIYISLCNNTNQQHMCSFIEQTFLGAFGNDNQNTKWMMIMFMSFLFYDACTAQQQHTKSAVPCVYTSSWKTSKRVFSGEPKQSFLVSTLAHLHNFLPFAKVSSLLGRPRE